MQRTRIAVCRKRGDTTAKENPEGTSGGYMGTAVGLRLVANDRVEYEKGNEAGSSIPRLS